MTFHRAHSDRAAAIGRWLLATIAVYRHLDDNGQFTGSNRAWRRASLQWRSVSSVPEARERVDMKDCGARYGILTVRRKAHQSDEPLTRSAGTQIRLHRCIAVWLSYSDMLISDLPQVGWQTFGRTAVVARKLPERWISGFHVFRVIELTPRKTHGLRRINRSLATASSSVIVCRKLFWLDHLLPISRVRMTSKRLLISETWYA